MNPRVAIPVLIGVLMAGADVCASDASTVLAGRRLFFDEATRQRIDAGAARHRQPPGVAPSPSPARSSLSDATVPAARSDHAGASRSGGRATVVGRLGRQRIVDGVPLQASSP